MLIRLLKYDLKKMLKFLSVFALLALFFGLLTRLCGELEDSLALSIIKGILNGTTISMMCSLMINCFMRSWVLFRSSLYGDESYLTHTLPVKTQTVYTSKALTAALSVLFSMASILLVLFVTYWTEDLKQMIKMMLTPVSVYLDIPISGMITFLLAVLFLEFFNGIQIGFVGLVIGHRFNQSKILLSVIIGFAAYMITQSLSLIGMLVIGLLDADFMEIFSTSNLLEVSREIVIKATLMGTAFYVLFCVLGYVLNSKLLSRGVNVD